jgi:stearoyl-CoA desaturase (Delta-9 desaturase)
MIGAPGHKLSGELDDIMYPNAAVFALMHIAALGVLWTSATASAVALCLILYIVRMFGVCAGYHRYFSHRTFSTSRAFQFVLAFLAQSSAQKSVLWWAAHHRNHHRYADTDRDPHSPQHTGLWHAHVGWIFTARHDKVDLSTVGDLAVYPELLWLHRFERVPAIILGCLSFVLSGWPGLIIGFLWSTLLLYHATFLINSVAHMHGEHPYVTGDHSRNNWLLAILTMGEGWHNNHHAYPSSVRQGFQWWEVDLTYYVLVILCWLGVVWKFKTPPRSVLARKQRLGSRIIERAASDLAATFDARRLVAATDRDSGESTCGTSNPAIPLPAEVARQAELMFGSTPSLKQIIERAHQKIYEAVRQQVLLTPGVAGRNNDNETIPTKRLKNACRRGVALP